MKTLLLINSSGRITRSITRHLAGRFAAAWKSHNSAGTVLDRDVGLHPPRPVNEPWIAAAFSESAGSSSSGPLAVSDQLIDEVLRADVIVFGVPMYNFGMPAQLKAYFDQLVRIGRAFAFEPGQDNPYRPLLPSKPVVVIESVGDGSLLPGGALAHLNFLEPHIKTILEFIGLVDITFVRAGYDEYQDDRAKRSLSNAEATIDQLAARLHHAA